MMKSIFKKEIVFCRNCLFPGRRVIEEISYLVDLECKRITEKTKLNEKYRCPKCLSDKFIYMYLVDLHRKGKVLYIVCEDYYTSFNIDNNTFNKIINILNNSNKILAILNIISLIYYNIDNCLKYVDLDKVIDTIDIFIKNEHKELIDLINNNIEKDFFKELLVKLI